MLVDTSEKWQKSLAVLGAVESELSWDTETNGLDYFEHHIVSVQIRTRAGDSYHFPFRHGEGANLPENCLRHLCTQVLRKDRPQVGYNLSFDIKMAAKEGLEHPEKISDPMLHAHLMNENEPSFKMEDLAIKYIDSSLGEASKKLTAMICEKFHCSEKKSKGLMWKLPAAQVCEYGEQDVENNFALLDFYTPQLKNWKLTALAAEVCDFQLALTAMEKRGILVDRDALIQLGEDAGPKADELERQIQDLCRTDMGQPDYAANPRSPKQMKLWLEPLLGVPNTSKPVLQMLDDPRTELLLAYRVWQKLKSSFADPLQNHIRADGRIHPGLFICTPGTREQNGIRGTCAGRISSAYPNLQQIPGTVQHAFVAREGYTLIQADYSQAESVAAAHYYATRFDEWSLAKILLSGADFHQITADAAGIPRKRAKTRNFAIQYGAGARMLATTYCTTLRQEQAYLRAYNTEIPGSKMLARQCQREAEARGYIRMWSGRTRRYNVPKAAPYKAKNNLLQGTVGEMLRVALTRLHKEYPEIPMVLTVHDSILFEVPTHLVQEYARIIRLVMQDTPWCTLPMWVDLGHGPNWATMEPLPREPDGVPAEALALFRRHQP